MKNHLLKDKTKDDIDRRVEKVLRGLGNPEPPLRLGDVRELLELDRHYYTANDDSILQETISRLKVAGIQVLKRPSILLDAIKKLELKALYLPDQKRILLDKTLPKPKHRWNEAHEIGHSLLPWHQDMMHGDNASCLSPMCHVQIEGEANYAAGRLLFLQDKFVEEANDTSPTIGAIRGLKDRYKNTYTTTLWRYIEAAHPHLPMAGVISVHPHVSQRPEDFDPQKPCRYFIQSPSFAEKFSRTCEVKFFEEISSYCGSQSGGPLGSAEKILVDDNGERHLFTFETFFNTYEALTLAVYDRPYNSIIAAA